MGCIHRDVFSHASEVHTVFYASEGQILININISKGLTGCQVLHSLLVSYLGKKWLLMTLAP